MDLTKDENEWYEKYEPEWASVRFFMNLKQLESIIRIYKNSKDDYTSYNAMRYHLATCYEFFKGDIDYISTWYLFEGTPIERLYYHCFDYIRRKEKIPLYLVPQYEIQAEKNKYIVDFLIRDFTKDEELNVIVECDGFDYHSSKKQQAYDNQRQRDLENAGYKVIRFSGKEIYDDEVKCVYETLKSLNIEVKQ